MAGLLVLSGAAAAGKQEYIDLADRGWNYTLRETMLGRDLSIPVQIHGKTLAGAALCIVGDAPVKGTQVVLDTFRDLVAHVYGKPLTMRYAGRSSDGCGSGRTVVLRLYSGRPPNAQLSHDLDNLNKAYGLGLPKGRYYAANSPAMAQTFFGRIGQATHIMVSQPRGAVTPIEAMYYKSILIEELYQAFTFGMDVLVFKRDATFMSKLQEFPLNPQRAMWGSHVFMRMMLSSNPTGLCDFDIFMLHAVAGSPTRETNTPGFIAYINHAYDDLTNLMSETVTDPRFAPILDRDCAPYRD